MSQSVIRSSDLKFYYSHIVRNVLKFHKGSEHSNLLITKKSSFLSHLVLMTVISVLGLNQTRSALQESGIMLHQDVSLI